MTLVTLPPYIDVYAYTPIASASVTSVTLWGARQHRRLVAFRLRRTALMASIPLIDVAEAVKALSRIGRVSDVAQSERT